MDERLTDEGRAESPVSGERAELHAELRRVVRAVFAASDSEVAGLVAVLKAVLDERKTEEAGDLQPGV